MILSPYLQMPSFVMLKTLSPLDYHHSFLPSFLRLIHGIASIRLLTWASHSHGHMTFKGSPALRIEPSLHSWLCVLVQACIPVYAPDFPLLSLPSGKPTLSVFWDLPSTFLLWPVLALIFPLPGIPVPSTWMSSFHPLTGCYLSPSVSLSPAVSGLVLSSCSTLILNIYHYILSPMRWSFLDVLIFVNACSQLLNVNVYLTVPCSLFTPVEEWVY